MILRFFDFDLILPTAATYIEIYIEAAILFTDLDRIKTRFRMNLAELKTTFAERVLTLLDLSLTSVEMTGYIPSLLAAAVLAAARSSLRLVTWPSTLQAITNHKYEELRLIVCELLKLHGAPKKGEKKEKSTPDSGYLSDKHGTDSDTMEEDEDDEADAEREAKKTRV